jgi:hypothetical protein
MALEEVVGLAIAASAFSAREPEKLPWMVGKKLVLCVVEFPCLPQRRLRRGHVRVALDRIFDQPVQLLGPKQGPPLTRNIDVAAQALSRASCDLTRGAGGGGLGAAVVLVGGRCGAVEIRPDRAGAQRRRRSNEGNA